MGRDKYKGYRNRKRSHDEFAERERNSVGKALALLRDSETPEGNGKPKDDDGAEDQGWEKVERSNKRQKKIPKKDSPNYPEIKFSPQARLHTYVKLGDLQGLVLYLLADGAAPQWCAVRHHRDFRKVVMLMVPGLESGMFDGSIDLPEEQGNTATLDKDEKVDPPANEQQDGGDSVPKSTFSSTKPHNSVPTTKYREKITLSPDDYYPTKISEDLLPTALKPLGAIFPHIWPVKCPGDDKYYRVHSPIYSMLMASLSERKDNFQKHKGARPAKVTKDWKDQKVPITAFIATSEELEANDYVLHPALFTEGLERENAMKKRQEAGQGLDDGWVDTNVEDLKDGEVPSEEIPKGSLTAGREILAIDCEMVKTSAATFSLARICVLGWTGQKIMDEFVKPSEPVVDYVTAYSGITEQMLANVTTTLKDIQKKLLDLITPRTILVGHSLDTDMKALKMTHPFTVDTVMLYPHPRGPPLKPKLSWLCQKYLNREIQKGHGATGHDPSEDARAALDLVRLKCEKGPQWGTLEASSEPIFKRIGRSPKPSFLKTNPVGDEMRSSAVVDWGDPKRGPGGNAEVVIGCKDDVGVVEGVKSILAGEKGSVDFIWARLRGVEIQRGLNNIASTLPVATGTYEPAKDDLTCAAEKDISKIDTNGIVSAPSEQSLTHATTETVSHIRTIWENLPPCTAFIVYNGHNDMRELMKLQAQQKQFKEEYKTKKWDELSVKWTDTEEQAMKRAAREARRGIGFIAVK